jgi:NAD(P)-dependent dehydrogenase (short-subunit alcohol dehydrogenase family)
MDSDRKTILITGGARRLGRYYALTAASAGMNVIIHHSHSAQEAEDTASEVRKLKVGCSIISVDFSNAEQTQEVMEELYRNHPIDFLVNNAAIFEPVSFNDTSLLQWHRHLETNLTAPFLLSQLFAKYRNGKKGRILNILDWRALRPGRDHFPYSISKAALAAMTKSLALNLAPDIQVNGLALGAILPPSDGNKDEGIIKQVPAGRWADMDELGQVFLFLLVGPAYITGEIIHLDGGRHLV